MIMHPPRFGPPETGRSWTTPIPDSETESTTITDWSVYTFRIEPPGES